MSESAQSTPNALSAQTLHLKQRKEKVSTKTSRSLGARRKAFRSSKQRSTPTGSRLALSQLLLLPSAEVEGGELFSRRQRFRFRSHPRSSDKTHNMHSPSLDSVAIVGSSGRDHGVSSSATTQPASISQTTPSSRNQLQEDLATATASPTPIYPSPETPAESRESSVHEVVQHGDPRPRLELPTPPSTEDSKQDQDQSPSTEWIDEWSRAKKQLALGGLQTLYPSKSVPPVSPISVEVEAFEDGESGSDTSVSLTSPTEDNLVSIRPKNHQKSRTSDLKISPAPSSEVGNPDNNILYETFSKWFSKWSSPSWKRTVVDPASEKKDKEGESSTSQTDCQATPSEKPSTTVRKPLVIKMHTPESLAHEIENLKVQGDPSITPSDTAVHEETKRLTELAYLT